MLDDSQLGELRDRGHVRVPGVAGAAATQEMQGLVWRFLESRGVEQSRPETWPDQIDKLQPLRKQRAFDGFLGRELDEVCDQLVGADWTDLDSPPQALISLPTAERWVLPHKMWHFDLPARGPTDTFGAVRFLGFVDDVGPLGGGTVVVEGSHELVRRAVAASPDNDAGSSADVRRQLSELPFFARLATPESVHGNAELGTADTIDGVDVRVVELTGGAGDLVVMHPWVMHNTSMNCSDRPRMMMTYTRYASGRAWF